MTLKTLLHKRKLQSLNDIDQFIFKGIKAKLNVIIKDEKEHNMRKYLNLGHTFGHAVEYKTKIPHGHVYDWNHLPIYSG